MTAQPVVLEPSARVFVAIAARAEPAQKRDAAARITRNAGKRRDNAVIIKEPSPFNLAANQATTRCLAGLIFRPFCQALRAMLACDTPSDLTQKLDNFHALQYVSPQ